ncbi:glycogen synthase GlgA [Sphingomonas rubra]|uniref:Glycogen synthase n=1 Tax=Sphingomonas rubra TaxID=634430 RepID=A0A1I5SBQ2_9SPHN|nr:glycogen synthase GlgA [Sphingomonas rubra]SFP68122.1 starch synthase [Sphingomonas rubra]
MRVLAVASECYPLVKTGGLADVVGALPAALAHHGVVTTTLLPGYPAMAQATRSGRVVHRWPDLLGAEARLIETQLGTQPLLVLDAPELYARPGGPYADESGRDWPDNWRRFAALSRAAGELAAGLVDGYRFDLLHAHDWQAGLAPAYARALGAAAKSVATIHNIAFQGVFDRGIFPRLGLPESMWSIDGLEYYGQVGFLKAGLALADRITTVSPTYAQEIRREQFGMGLQGLIATRGATGIVNGLDPAVWNPETDAALPARYTHRLLDRRSRNRAAVEQTFGLSEGGPLFCVVSRLTEQKGMDVLATLLDELVDGGGRLALLGSGDKALEAAFLAAAHRHPGSIGIRIGYDEVLSHLLQGGADAILIPSRFEPCGLTQLYGLAYGCVPVVARTGGLADTVIDANQAALAAGVATGIVHDGVTPDALSHAITRAMHLHARPPVWRRLQENGMRADWSWDASARTYADLFRQLTVQP